MCSASDNEKRQPKERSLSLIKPEASKREVRSNFLDNEELVF